MMFILLAVGVLASVASGDYSHYGSYYGSYDPCPTGDCWDHYYYDSYAPHDSYWGQSYDYDHYGYDYDTDHYGYDYGYDYTPWYSYWDSDYGYYGDYYGYDYDHYHDHDHYYDYDNYYYYEGGDDSGGDDCIVDNCQWEIDECFGNDACAFTVYNWMESGVCEQPNADTLPYSQCYDPLFQYESCQAHSNGYEDATDACAFQIGSLAFCHAQFCEEIQDEHCVSVKCGQELTECAEDDGCSAALDQAMKGACEECHDCCATSNMCAAEDDGCVEAWEALGWCYYDQCEEQAVEEEAAGGAETIEPKKLLSKGKKASNLGLRRMFRGKKKLLAKKAVARVQKSLHRVKAKKARKIARKKRALAKKKFIATKKLSKSFKTKKPLARRKKRSHQKRKKLLKQRKRRRSKSKSKKTKKTKVASKTKVKSKSPKSKAN